MKLTVFCNQRFTDPAAHQRLENALANHHLLYATQATTSNLVAAAHDPAIEQAHVAFGQFDPDSLLRGANLKWIHITTAGYDRYDRPDVRKMLRDRNIVFTNSSSVYNEPCAQHVMGLMLAHARQIPAAVINQSSNKGWPAADLRKNSKLIAGQTVLLLGYGAIARRLVELLAPYQLDIIAFRKNPTGKEPIRTVALPELDSVLPLADHVINILPGGGETRHFMNTQRFAQLKSGAAFYNIGRGTTVDQTALLHALQTGHIGAAYLDVTDPEPLPAGHALWSAPNCLITPHTAGGCDDEFMRLVSHFLGNLKRFETQRPLLDRILE